MTDSCELFLYVATLECGCPALPGALRNLELSASTGASRFHSDGIRLVLGEGTR